MLGALASSRAQQRRLVADAGHELRTPLTSLRPTSTCSHPGDGLPAAARAEVLADARLELEELSAWWPSCSSWPPTHARRLRWSCAGRDRWRSGGSASAAAPAAVTLVATRTPVLGKPDRPGPGDVEPGWITPQVDPPGGSIEVRWRAGGWRCGTTARHRACRPARCSSGSSPAAARAPRLGPGSCPSFSRRAEEHGGRVLRRQRRRGGRWWARDPGGRERRAA